MSVCGVCVVCVSVRGVRERAWCVEAGVDAGLRGAAGRHAERRVDPERRAPSRRPRTGSRPACSSPAKGEASLQGGKLLRVVSASSPENLPSLLPLKGEPP